MCINLCFAYMGPYVTLETCLECGEHCYDQEKLTASGGKLKVAHQTFHTIPLGPQLQALWWDPENAEKMHYWDWRTQEALDKLEKNGFISSYNDFFQGEDYLHAVSEGKIKSGDAVLMLSLDDTQLY